MKFTAGLVLAAVAVAGVSAGSTTAVDPATNIGLGPAVPTGNKSMIKKAMEELAGPHSVSGSDSNYYTIDPKTLPKFDPKFGFGLGPAVLPGMSGYGKNEAANKAWEEFQKKEGGSTNGKTRKLEAADSSNTLTIDPKSLPIQDPKSLEGLGPQVPAGPNVKKAMSGFASKESGSTNTLDIPKIAPPTFNPAMYEGLGPAELPGMLGYGQNAQFNKAWKEFTKQEGASTGSSGSGVSKCPEVCPEVYDPVCGSDGVTYSNSCFMGTASCNNPDKHIAKASEGACPTQTTQSTQN
ncbi:hypothetical protein JG688_00018640 [Phytophthora aleatoria]|uniref:Kazal-like domain-containing protein n=1 Tax=Phytophthora aleatoria TaxID=2496075 RepID=A0A8J5IR13_9STRA|nr:hypothetical protein JG688_00018640 [Phytophthora aleatoria]